MLPYAAHVCMMESVVASTVVLGLWHPGLVLNFECFCSRVAFFFLHASFWPSVGRAWCRNVHMMEEDEKKCSEECC